MNYSFMMKVSFPPQHTRHHRHFSASSFQLIFIHAMRSEKIKAGETAHRQSSIDLLNEKERRREKNLLTSKMIEISKDVYLMGRV